MTIFIGDDSKSDRLRLIHHLKKYLKDLELLDYYDIVEFSNGSSLIDAWKAAKEKPLLVFLDIYMGDPNGIATAEKLRELGAQCNIIFTTSSNEFATESYRVRALYYLCKPYDHNQFESAMIYCKSNLQNAANNYTISVRGENIDIPINNIIYFETGNHVVLLHTTMSSYSFVSSMSKVRNFFDKNAFFLAVGSSYLVNVKYIKKRAKDSLVMLNDQVIPIPVRIQKDVKKHLDAIFDN
ncbi:MAG: LytTR family DNA-binding domain-containing protein [Lachnospiraceae bacterium]|nr:LytTR family DNA-binding domain-containing protein [Lachnospiraceae bacterium]